MPTAAPYPPSVASRSLRAVVLTMGALLLPLAAMAQATQQRATPNQAADVAASSGARPDPIARGLRDRAELEAFLDGVMVANLRDKHIAGATVAVVKDGALLFAKGYGYADVDARTPVTAEGTLFRIGSISKLFTWTAIMQLAEQGKVDLDADVNQYLDFEIPATYAEPITLRHILTHTPGFEEDARDLFTNDSTRLVTNAQWVATHIPGRVRRPGLHSSYSNYATALAGYIIERVSGEAWEPYIERHILEPLGMSRTTGRQPLPAPLAGGMSGGFQWVGGYFKRQPFEIVNGGAPAGSVSATATDMAHFMLAHLGGGVHPNGTRILADSTARLMHTRAFTHDERLPGFALGFYEKSSHGLRIIGHGGDTQWFHSDLALIPEERLGIFVSYNSATGGELSFGPFLTQFLDHYFPVPPTVAVPTAEAEEQARLVAGSYAFNRRSYTTFQKSLGLAGAINVKADSGRLVANMLTGPIRMVPVGSYLWREELGGTLVAFEENGGAPTRLGYISAVPMMTLERLSWSESPPLHWVILGLGVVVFLATIVAAVARGVRRRLGTPRPEDPLPGRWWVTGLALSFVAFFVALGVVASGDLFDILTTPMTPIRVALVFPVIGALLTVGALVAAIRNARAAAGTRAARWRHAGTVVVAVAFLWSLNVWHLLGWRF